MPVAAAQVAATAGVSATEAVQFRALRRNGTQGRVCNCGRVNHVRETWPHGVRVVRELVSYVAKHFSKVDSQSVARLDCRNEHLVRGVRIKLGQA